MNTLLQGIFDTTATSTILLSSFMACVAVALCIGAFLSFVYAYRSKYTKSFLLTLFILPAIVCVVIMMVNGNIGAGVAVAGAFSLVRFRSVAGTARDIASIFLAMGTGLLCGMGYLGYAVIFALVIGLMMMLFQLLRIGSRSGEDAKVLRITIPEDLNYSEVFDEPLEKYTSSYEMTSVKTTNMGSMFKLTYNINLVDPNKEKDLMDELRMRNGNLEISIMKQECGLNEL